MNYFFILSQKNISAVAEASVVASLAFLPPTWDVFISFEVFDAFPLFPAFSLACLRMSAIFFFVSDS